MPAKYNLYQRLVLDQRKVQCGVKVINGYKVPTYKTFVITDVFHSHETQYILRQQESNSRIVLPESDISKYFLECLQTRNEIMQMQHAFA